VDGRPCKAIGADGGGGGGRVGRCRSGIGSGGHGGWARMVGEGWRFSNFIGFLCVLFETIVANKMDVVGIEPTTLSSLSIDQSL
jgi:hypothetical protein